MIVITAQSEHLAIVCFSKNRKQLLNQMNSQTQMNSCCLLFKGLLLLNYRLNTQPKPLLRPRTLALTTLPWGAKYSMRSSSVQSSGRWNTKRLQPRSAGDGGWLDDGKLRWFIVMIHGEGEFIVIDWWSMAMANWWSINGLFVVNWLTEWLVDRCVMVNGSLTKGSLIFIDSAGWLVADYLLAMMNNNGFRVDTNQQEPPKNRPQYEFICLSCHPRNAKILLGTGEASLWRDWWTES